MSEAACDASWWDLTHLDLHILCPDMRNSLTRPDHKTEGDRSMCLLASKWSADVESPTYSPEYSGHVWQLAIKHARRSACAAVCGMKQGTAAEMSLFGMSDKLENCATAKPALDIASRESKQDPSPKMPTSLSNMNGSAGSPSISYCNSNEDWSSRA